MSSPFVTTVIPCHNYGRWVSQAIHSVVAQDYPQKAIVVVDDGSTDGSLETVLAQLGSYETLGNRRYHGNIGLTPVTVIRFEKAGGAAFARNRGIETAWEQTDVFGILDADDLWKPGRIERCVKEFEGCAHVGLVYTDYETFNDDTGLVIREYKEPYGRERLFASCMVTNACFISRSAFEVVGLYDEAMRVAEDYDLFLRLSEKFLLVHVPEALAAIRVGAHNTTHRISAEVWQANWRRCSEKARVRGGL